MTKPTKVPYMLSGWDEWDGPIVLTGDIKVVMELDVKHKYYQAKQVWFWGLWTELFWVHEKRIKYFTPRTETFYPGSAL